MRSIFVLVALLTATPFAQEARADGTNTFDGEVDVQLVLAVDVSGSVSARLSEKQRNGFAAAFREPDLQQAISSGLTGRIAVTYFEWAGVNHQRVIIPWRILSTSADTVRFAEALETSPELKSGGETSISSAITFAGQLFEENGLRSFRKVVDISGNGRNSEGPDPAVAFAALRERGVTVNGLVLPVADAGPYGALFARDDGSLVDYYRSDVIGGPGAFAIEIDMDRDIVNAILRKLVLEIAWLSPEAAFIGRNYALRP